MAEGPEPDADLEMELETISPFTPSVFTPPSIHHNTLLSGASYKHVSPIPPSLLPPKSLKTSESAETPIGPPCALGVDEAGRGPVLGPMVYGVFYLPIPLSKPLLSDTHHFDDSKVLTPAFRAELMEKLCTPSSSPTSTTAATEATSPDPSSLYDNCGWAVDLLSARSISSSMLHHTPYNLNAQAMDATIALIQAIIAKGVNVKEIYIDTIGQPGPYQKKLERIFPTASVTVAKKADSLYPCVSAASVCAKVTRDKALEVLYEAYTPVAVTQKQDIKMGDCESKMEEEAEEKAPQPAEADWGSGYPSDVRCTSWLKRNIDPIFGWGPECRFSWGTAKDLLENKAMAANVQWPVEQDDESHRLTDYFGVEGERGKGEDGELAGWFGSRVGVEAF